MGARVVDAHVLQRLQARAVEVGGHGTEEVDVREARAAVERPVRVPAVRAEALEPGREADLRQRRAVAERAPPHRPQRRRQRHGRQRRGPVEHVGLQVRLAFGHREPAQGRPAQTAFAEMGTWRAQHEVRQRRAAAEGLERQVRHARGQLHGRHGRVEAEGERVNRRHGTPAQRRRHHEVARVGRIAPDQGHPVRTGFVEPGHAVDHLRLGRGRQDRHQDAAGAHEHTLHHTPSFLETSRHADAASREIIIDFQKEASLFHNCSFHCTEGEEACKRAEASARRRGGGERPICGRRNRHGPRGGGRDAVPEGKIKFFSVQSAARNVRPPPIPPADAARRAPRRRRGPSRPCSRSGRRPCRDRVRSRARRT